MHNKTLYLTTRIGPGSQIEMKFFQIHSNEFGPCLTQLHDTTILDFEPTCLSMTEWNGTIRGLFATASKPRYLFIMDIGGVFYSVPLHPASKYHGGKFPHPSGSKPSSKHSCCGDLEVF